jgi:hypothetical protein
MSLLPSYLKIARLGFHYFPDTNHYRNSDLETWLAELRGLEAAWLILPAPLERAIPEDFLSAVINAGIQPILHFRPKIESFLDQSTLNLMLKQYSRWGVRHTIFFDRPNIRSSWSPAAWSQVDLVDRFLDKYIPCAELLLEYSMTPIFPGLQPGGDYWDLAFLRSALSSLLRRGKQEILDQLVLGAYATVVDRSLDWGAGGPVRWNETRPYHDTPEIEDHRGFHIYEWYLSTAEEVVGKSLPVILLEVGFHSDDLEDEPSNKEALIATQDLTLLKKIAGSTADTKQPDLPNGVLACFFCLVSSGNPVKSIEFNWYTTEGHPRPVVDAARRWLAGLPAPHLPTIQEVIEEISADGSPPEEEPQSKNIQEETPAQAETCEPLINHYILLPLYAWGAAEWDFELISPLLHDSHPTVGFSLEEASRAERVTVVGGPGVISEEAMTLLRNAGCSIERLLENGTVIAS